MEKLIGKEIGEFYRHSPMAVAVITVHANGKDNGMSAAWVSPMSFNPPLYGVSIASKRHTFSMIVEAGEFVTPDLNPNSKAGTIEMGEAIIAAL